MTEAKEQITVDKSVYTKLEGRVELTQFDNVDEYANYVFEELLHYLGEPDDDPGIVDQEQLKDRLQSLGYIQE